MEYGYIYVLTCLITMKEYVGQAKCWRGRWKQHCHHALTDPQFLIHRAMSAYGVENFAITIVRRCFVEDLNYWEEYYVEKFDTLAPYGYNMTEGGDGVRGMERTAMHRARHRAAMKKFYIDNPEARAEMSLIVKAAFAKRPSLLRRLHAAKRGKATGRKGMKLPPEWRAKLSAAQLRRFQDPAQRAIRSETARKAYVKDPELRRAVSAAQKEMWSDPEYHARMRKRMVPSEASCAKGWATRRANIG